jgi:hypothetical protein
VGPRAPPREPRIRRSAGDSGRMGTRPAWPRRRGRFCPGAVAGSVDRSRGIVATLLRGAALSAGRPPLSLVPKTSTALDAGDDCRFHPVGVCWLGRPQLTRWLTSAVAPTVNAAVSGAAEASDISGSDRDCRFRDERKPEDRRRELRPSPGAARIPEVIESSGFTRAAVCSRSGERLAPPGCGLVFRHALARGAPAGGQMRSSDASALHTIAWVLGRGIYSRRGGRETRQRNACI